MNAIGERILRILFLPLFLAGPAFAGIQASIDRQEVPQDESVTLKITRTGDSDRPLNPRFEAPDFEVMNQFQNSQFSSVYVNGKFENRSEESITFVLRPLKIGALRIRNIQSNGERAPDLTIRVIQEQLYKKSVPGEAPALKGDAKNFFVRGEVNKARVTKGEQIIVSFYLYRRTRANVRDVLQYPSFQGFIREDLEMPILSGRPDFEAVNLGGVPMERALLARYAVYPIKEGKLKIDGFSVRVDYVPKNPATDEMLEDPVFQFFSQVTPRSGSSRSDPILVDVTPLPEDGKSALFTGGVGDFEVTSTLDSQKIQAHAPLTLKVAIKGKGNTSLVEFPKVDWPKGIKLYESQGKSKSLGQGLSEKVFEAVLIPEAAGELTIPPVEFEFFNPESRSYVRRKSDPIPLRVEPGDPSLAPKDRAPEESTTPAGGTGKSATSTGYGALRERDKHPEGGFWGEPWWRLVAWVGLLMFFAFVGLVAFDQMKKRSLARLEILKKKQGAEEFWTKLIDEASGTRDPSGFGRLLERAGEECYKSLDEAYALSSRALPKRELGRILTEQHSFPEADWNDLRSLFDLAEQLRFSSAPGETAEAMSERVIRLVAAARRICGNLPRKSMERQA